MATINYTAGPDDIVSGATADKHYLGAGDDTIHAGDGNDTIYGGDGDDVIYGEGGDDQLQGNEGNDTMYGGIGNDTYAVEDIGDRVVEFDGEGIDTVISSIQNYTLPAFVEHLNLAGTANINGKGNDLGNAIRGNSGNNTLDGRGGNDSINAGDGNDIVNGGLGDDQLDGGAGQDLITFKVDGPTSGPGVTVDLAITGKQNTGLGIDIIKNFEDLEGSNGDDNLKGDNNANRISAIGGNDTITGRGGNDELNGGLGADTFIFSAAAVNGTDTIRAFTSGVDKLQFYVADGYSAGATLTENTTGAASGSGAQFIHNTATHTFAYDADGDGAGAATILAIFLPDVVSLAGDIVIS